MAYLKAQYLGAAIRMGLGFIFLWAFFDKVFGWGFATPAGKAWIDGVSPTMGFLKNAAYGPLSSWYHALAGNIVVDWLFMLGLLCIGLALMLGIGLRIAGITGAALMLFMYGALLPPKNNPLLDDHIIYALILVLVAVLPLGYPLGLGKWWTTTKLVKKYWFLA